MAGKGEARHLPTLSAASTEIENAERHRQPLAPIDHAHEVGVLQIVVGEVIAAIAVGADDYRAQRLGSGGSLHGPHGGSPEIARKRRQMLPIAHEGDLRPIERGECERRLADGPRGVAERTQAREVLQGAAPVVEQALRRACGHCSGCTCTGGRGEALLALGGIGVGRNAAGCGAVVAGAGLPRT